MRTLNSSTLDQMTPILMVKRKIFRLPQSQWKLTGGNSLTIACTERLKTMSCYRQTTLVAKNSRYSSTWLSRCWSAERMQTVWIKNLWLRTDTWKRQRNWSFVLGYTSQRMPTITARYSGGPPLRPWNLGRLRGVLFASFDKPSPTRSLCT